MSKKNNIKKKNAKRAKYKKIFNKYILPTILILLLIVLLVLTFTMYQQQEQGGEFQDIEVESFEDLYHSGDEIRIYYFWTQGCPICTNQATPFMNEIIEKYPDIKVLDFQLDSQQKSELNSQIIQEMAEKYEFQPGSVPLTIIGEEVFKGHSPQEIERKIEKCINDGCRDKLVQ